MNNRDRLMAIISENQLERREVADLLRVKTDEVDQWLLSSESRHHAEMPDMAIELLELKISTAKADQADKS